MDTVTIEPWTEPIPAVVAPFCQRVKGMKTERVARTRKGEDDQEPFVQFLRDGSLVAVGFCQNVDRDEALQLIHIGVSGFAADAIETVFDAHKTDQRWMEKYGRMPDPGELQHVCDAEGACELGLTTDTMWCMRYERDGSYMAIDLPYHINDQARQVHWQPDNSVLIPDAEKGNELSGRVHDSIMAAFERSLPFNIADAAKEFDMTLEQARREMDISLVKMLGSAGYTFLLALPPGADPAEFAERLEGEGLGIATDADGAVKRSNKASPMIELGRDLGKQLEAERRRLKAEDEMTAAQNRKERREAERKARKGK